MYNYNPEAELEGYLTDTDLDSLSGLEDCPCGGQGNCGCKQCQCNQMQGLSADDGVRAEVVDLPPVANPQAPPMLFPNRASANTSGSGLTDTGKSILQSVKSVWDVFVKPKQAKPVAQAIYQKDYSKYYVIAALAATGIVAYLLLKKVNRPKAANKRRRR